MIGAVAIAIWWLTRPLPVLTVTTWPGAYERAQANAMFHPFGEAERVDVRIAEYDGGLDHLREEVRRHVYDWDVVDLELADAVRACHENLLEPMSADTFPAGADGKPARRDFLPFANGRCWIGSVVFAQIIAYAPGRFSTEPRRASDFFDLSRYPGGRGLHRSGAKLNLELALLADGVASQDVYPTLSTAAGVSRALAKLAQIRSAIVWWESPSDALAMLANGRASMTTALNGDAYNAQIHGRNVGVIWDNQLDELDVFGIPRNDPRRDLAMDFIRFATSSKPLARVADWLPYGPSRRSALALVGDNPERNVRMKPFLPTVSINAASAFAVDDEWWRAHGPSVAPLWQRFLDQGR